MNILIFWEKKKVQIEPENLLILKWKVMNESLRTKSSQSTIYLIDDMITVL